MEGMLLQTVEGLGETEPYRPSGNEIWEWLESERQDVASEISSEGPLCPLAVRDAQEVEASSESDREIEWHFRGQLEARLRELNEAEDRLRTGAYGHCEDAVRRSTNDV
jgi:RNA polymerase-binding transcription factor DksA